MTGTTWLTRQLRWLGAGHNQLARPWDRLEAALVVTATILALSAIPIALTVGSEVRADALATAAAQRATRTETTAVLLDGAPYAPSSEAQVASPTPVEAWWRLPDGSERTGLITADPGTPEGARVAIWLDPAGDPVAQPMTATNALGAGLSVAVLVWAGVIVSLGLLLWLARLVLDRARAAAWAREWARMGRDLNRF